MNMVAINTPGKGVHDILSEEDFHEAMFGQLLDNQREGLAAILVGSDSEARYLLGEFSDYGEKLHDMTGGEFGIHRTRWNVIHINDARGLEFSSVIALSGRMSRNQQYIAYTRALDDLYIYKGLIDVSAYENGAESGAKNKPANPSVSNAKKKSGRIHNEQARKKPQAGNAVRSFFEEHGLDVIDERAAGGRLWVIGEKTDIKSVVDEAVSRFGISGKYVTGKEGGKGSGWCSKTDK